MKYLNNYTEEATTNALNKAGGFFAFSDEQFNRQKKENVKYVSMGMGLICPKETAKQLMEDLQNIIQEGIKTDLKENTKRGVVVRELNNHEAFYTGSIEDTVDALGNYGITAKYIQAVYWSEFDKQRN